MPQPEDWRAGNQLHVSGFHERGPFTGPPVITSHRLQGPASSHRDGGPARGRPATARPESYAAHANRSVLPPPPCRTPHRCLIAEDRWRCFVRRWRFLASFLAEVHLLLRRFGVWSRPSATLSIHKSKCLFFKQKDHTRIFKYRRPNLFLERPKDRLGSVPDEGRLPVPLGPVEGIFIKKKGPFSPCFPLEHLLPIIS